MKCRIEFWLPDEPYDNLIAAYNATELACIPGHDDSVILEGVLYYVTDVINVFEDHMLTVQFWLEESVVKDEDQHLAIIRRSAERGRRLAHEAAPDMVDIFQHILDELGRIK